MRLKPSEVGWAALVYKMLLRNPSKFHFHIKTIHSLLRSKNQQSITRFLSLDLSQYCKNDLRYWLVPKASKSRPAATAADAETPCVLPIRPAKLCRGTAPRAHPFICRQNFRLPSGTSFGSDWQMTCRSSNLDSNWNSAAWPTSYKSLISSSEIPE